jgi:hypothetical protein
MSNRWFNDMLTYPKNLEGSLTILGEKGTVKIGGVAVNEINHWEFADKKDYDRKKAISAFVAIDDIKIDESLQDVAIKIPAQVQNYSWPIDLDKSSIRPENIAFISQKNKKNFLNNP